MTDDVVIVDAKIHSSLPLYRVFAASAIIGILGWLGLLSVFIWWTLEPVTLPRIEQPIEVMNANKEVAIGTSLELRLEIYKTENISPTTVVRFLECKSGNLVTLTSTNDSIPVGSYEILSQDVVIPAKITPGDICNLVLQARFDINPIKTENTKVTSEKFLVLPPLKEN